MFSQPLLGGEALQVAHGMQVGHGELLQVQPGQAIF